MVVSPTFFPSSPRSPFMNGVPPQIFSQFSSPVPAVMPVAQMTPFQHHGNNAVIPPDYFRDHLQSNTENSHWEIQNLRKELEGTYQQLHQCRQELNQASNVHNQNDKLMQQLQFCGTEQERAQESLGRLRIAESDWSKKHSELEHYRQQQAQENANLRNNLGAVSSQNKELEDQLQHRHRQAWNAWQRLREEEERWHQVLQKMDDQSHKLEVVTHENSQFRSKEQELEHHLSVIQHELQQERQETSRLHGVREELTYARQMLSSANEEISSLRGVEESLATRVEEVTFLRKQLASQETDIDKYTHETQCFFETTNGEVSTLRDQLQVGKSENDRLRQRLTMLPVAEAEVERLRQQIGVAEKEIDRFRTHLGEGSSHSARLQNQVVQLTQKTQMTTSELGRMAGIREQLTIAENEIVQLRSELVEGSSQTTFLQGQVKQQTRKASIATAELERLAGDRTVSSLGEKLAAAEREIIHLRNCNSEQAFDFDRRMQDTDRDRKLERVAISRDRTSNSHGEILIKEREFNCSPMIHQHVQRLEPHIQRMEPPRMQILEPHVQRMEPHVQRMEPPMMQMLEPHVQRMEPPMMQMLEPHNQRMEPPMMQMLEPHVPIVSSAWAEPVRYVESPQSFFSPQKSPLKADVIYAYFGVEVAEGATLKNLYGEDQPIPAVRVVNTAGPCALAGLLANDLVSSINGRQVASLDDFNEIVATIPPHSSVKIVFERDGNLLGADVLTEETPTEPGKPGKLRG